MNGITVMDIAWSVMSSCARSGSMPVSSVTWRIRFNALNSRYCSINQVRFDCLGAPNHNSVSTPQNWDAYSLNIFDSNYVRPPQCVTADPDSQVGSHTSLIYVIEHSTVNNKYHLVVLPAAWKIQNESSWLQLQDVLPQHGREVPKRTTFLCQALQLLNILDHLTVILTRLQRQSSEMNLPAFSNAYLIVCHFYSKPISYGLGHYVRISTPPGVIRTVCLNCAALPLSLDAIVKPSFQRTHLSGLPSVTCLRKA